MANVPYNLNLRVNESEVDIIEIGKVEFVDMCSWLSDTHLPD